LKATRRTKKNQELCSKLSVQMADTPELDALAQLLSQHELFELLPPHAKIVALDADLPMHHSLLALAQHHADGLPIWDSALQRFVDIFSTMDLVAVLHYSHATKLGASAAHQTSPVAAIERAHLRDLHGLKRSKPATGFAKASIEDSIYHGALQLNQHRLECLPIGEANSASSLLHLLHPEQVLAFLASLPKFRTVCPTLLGLPLDAVVLPHCRPLHTLAVTASLADALALLSGECLWALPLVDANGALVDVISCRDARQLAVHGSLADMGAARLDECLLALPPTPPRLQSCAAADTVEHIITRLASSQVAQVVVLDEGGAVAAVVTASDVLCSLVR
jgi:5'-AMP-activated protein kinase regulatory gamma subunit